MLMIALELSDAAVDVLGYACLVAIMSMGQGYHHVSEARLHKCTVEHGQAAPVVTSAGALIEGLKVLEAKRIALVAPYQQPLTPMRSEARRVGTESVSSARHRRSPNNY